MTSTSGRRPFTAETRGEGACIGFEHGEAALTQKGHVRHHGGVVHIPVHSRGHERGATRRQEQGGEGIVGDTMGGLGDEVSGGRGHRDAVGQLGEGDVLHGLFALGIEQVREHRAAGERPKGQWAYELAGVFGKANGDPRA